ncbi:hypothetical protein R50072_22210 [Simiduia litorea]|uniref:hypothetical protein n=1 Tax=Simiduia litorea TaxID=1435348 RepID=UPI0036F31CE4
MVKPFLNVKCLLLTLVAGVAAAQAPLSDPTAPLGFSVKAAQAQPFTLNSIFKSATQSKAIVNGKLVKVGDRVNGGKILAISDTEVAVETKDGVQRLALHGQIKKNSATQ